MKDKTGKLIFQGKWREKQFSKDNGCHQTDLRLALQAVKLAGLELEKVRNKMLKTIRESSESLPAHKEMLFPISRATKIKKKTFKQKLSNIPSY
ncbi:MAG: hypothetical protein H7A25_25835 [Leptospiraceae bacterium]|nr:hypothetical protein [Leptospiraceae bacterium]